TASVRSPMDSIESLSPQLKFSHLRNSSTGLISNQSDTATHFQRSNAIVKMPSGSCDLRKLDVPFSRLAKVKMQLSPQQKTRKFELRLQPTLSRQPKQQHPNHVRGRTVCSRLTW